MAWHIDPLVLLALLGVGVAYGLGMRGLRARAPFSPSQRRSTALFLAGYLTLVVALLSPLHNLGEQIFSVHMLQHLLLTQVAAPLLLWASSMPVMLWALPERDRPWIGHLAGTRAPLGRALRLVTHPVIAWTLYLVAQWLWHQPWAYQWALESHWAHYAEHLSFFGAALLFWWPVVGAAPLGSPLGYPARLLYTFLAWIPNTVLGAGITLSVGLLYPHYARTAEELGIDAHGDQVLAGLIMWVPGDVLFLVILLVLLASYLRQEERDAVRIDRELDARDLELARAKLDPRPGGRA